MSVVVSDDCLIRCRFPNGYILAVHDRCRVTIAHRASSGLVTSADLRTMAEDALDYANSSEPMYAALRAALPGVDFAEAPDSRDWRTPEVLSELDQFVKTACTNLLTDAHGREYASFTLQRKIKLSKRRRLVRKVFSIHTSR